jgi:octaprenyl-diphosphate synthase
MGRDLAGLPSRVERFIGSELQQVEQIFRAELESRNPYVADIFTHVAHFRGKRLRPMLLLLSASATGPLTEAHRVLAAVVEMIHTATLVHDDVLDEAETRRHIATVNTRWNNETSVLFGDYLFTHAFHLASSLNTTLACRLIGRSTNIVCEGELTQIRERGNLELSEEAYIRIIDGKTAELCAASCYLGAHFAEADEAVSTALEQYGRCVGLAFQISDDLLDILGSESETGKSLGSDFKKQKLTLPLIRLLAQVEEPDLGRLRELLTQADDEAWTEVVRWLHRSDAVEYSRCRALEYVTTAQSHLDCLNDSAAKRILLEIADFATQRTF